MKVQGIAPHDKELSLNSVQAARLTLVLSMIAAVLALGAAGVAYFREGEIRWWLVAAAAFMLALGLRRTPPGRG